MIRPSNEWRDDTRPYTSSPTLRALRRAREHLRRARTPLSQPPPADDRGNEPRLGRGPAFGGVVNVWW
jgi:hypothetical protein